MGKIIKDIIKSTSFPSVESLHAQDDVAWENMNHDWNISYVLSSSASLTWAGDQLDTRRKFAFDPERLRVA